MSYRNFFKNETNNYNVMKWTKSDNAIDNASKQVFIKFLDEL